MTEKRIENLISYVQGSITMLEMLKKKDPEKFDTNAKISTFIFSDILNILNHLKSNPEYFENIKQDAEEYDSIFDEISKLTMTQAASKLPKT